MPEPIATWNPARDAWETDQGLFCGHSDVFSGIWPTSGMTRAGVAYALPTWAPRTPGSGSSLLLGTPRTSSANRVGQYEASERGTRGRLEAQVDLLLKTPTSQLAVNGGSQHPETRKAGGHGPTLADEIEHLLPTPTATPYGSNQSPSPGAAVRPSLEGVARLLPTPTAMDQNSSGGSNETHVTLTDAVVRTSLGARTNPRFGDGSASPDQLPLPASPDEPVSDSPPGSSNG